MSDKVLLYHANCPDGFGAAWAFWSKYKDDMEYIPVSHGKEPPNVSGKDVIIADFCYKRDILETLRSKSNSLIVIDHHKSAKEDCGDLDYCYFNMDHSGAVLAWKHVFPDCKVPLILQYIEDRDLWKWELDSTEKILSAVDSFDRTFENWDLLNLKLNHIDSDSWKALVDSGDSILRYKNGLIRSLLSNAHTIDILGELVPAINAPFFQSELAAELAKSSEYAAAYYFDGDSYKFSLRSKDCGKDVSSVAGNFGGGGHRNASGFRVKSLSMLKYGELDE